jgi:hypothetical protein
VVGGESGPGARPMHPDWVRTLRDQCATVGVPFLFKQWGEWCPADEVEEYDADAALRLRADAQAGDNDRVHVWADGATVGRFGKKLAGRLLDGVQHDGYPAELAAVRA